MTDEIKLVIPAEEDFRHIAQLVVAGLGARLDLTLERLDDLQVAIEALLALRDDEDDVVIKVLFEEGLVRTAVGPFPEGALAELDGDSSTFGLRRVLETVCDAFEVEERDDGSWVELTKSVATPEPAGA